MISAVHISGLAYAVNLDVPDSKAIRKLADAYGIPFEAMLIGCINKGIDVIGKQVQDNESRDTTEQPEQEQEQGG